MVEVAERGVEDSSGPHEPARPSGSPDDVLARRTRRWAITAAVLCPCHLPLVAWLLGVAGAGALGSAVASNRWVLTAVLAPAAAFALWRAVRTTTINAARRQGCGMGCAGRPAPPSPIR